VIRLQNVSIQAGAFGLSSISFEIPRGTYAVLMGKTGSGKTTLLESIAGLKPVLAGQIFLDGRDVTRLKPAERNIGYVPQDGALFSTMTVRDQLAFAQVIRGRPANTISRRVAELAELLEIEPLLDRSIRGLSGGEQQRVAIGRALSFGPSTLLLDEPLSALDEETRSQMFALLEHVRERSGVTALHVTHNVEEAMRLADLLFRVEASGVRLSPVARENVADAASVSDVPSELAFKKNLNPADTPTTRHAK
jgi:ABC-type sugar transport system ATPase subunit